MQTQFALGDKTTLGGKLGVIVDGTCATATGEFEFSTAGGSVQGTVLKAQDPDVVLVSAQVWLVEEMEEEQPAGRYAVMVDDPYWGLRIQAAAFAEAPIDEILVMGYRLAGRVLENGTPIAGANVSFEVTLTTDEDGDVLLWDSEEYNELVYSATLNTWVEGPSIVSAVRTDVAGEWETIVPKGHGAIYQRATDRRDESSETASRPLSRCVSKINAVYRGEKAEALEGSVAVIDRKSCTLRVTGTPGAWVTVSTMDDVGQAHLVPPSGEVVINGLPRCEHSVVQYKRSTGGSWDSTWGCARQNATLVPGATTDIDMGPMEEYPLSADRVSGRVYERMGVPASGVDIVAIDLETYEIVGTVATTDGSGLWSADVPVEGFGGELFIHDATWGSVPVLGSTYSDIVLGARVYSSWLDAFRPEAWRKGDFGHKNFPYVPDGLWLEDAGTSEEFEIEEALYGGWQTIEALPKYAHVADTSALINGGPVLRLYNIVDPWGIIEADVQLGTQPFEAWETPTGMFRASGYYPEAKHLIGGKIHGNVLDHSNTAIDADHPEAGRFGLEFGEELAHVEMRSGANGELCDYSAVTGLVCPYCGGPAWRDPGPGVAARGYCCQCAVKFGLATAMDCRTYFRSPTVGARHSRRQRAVKRVEDAALSREVRYFWRPDIYDETDDFVTQSGAGQPTNAPRWIAKHVDAFGDGKGLGKFDGDLSEPFVAGHDLPYFGDLPEVDRDLGLGQLKIVFGPSYVMPSAVTVAMDCVLDTGEIETRTVTVPAGLKGPCAEAPFGDAVRIVDAPKMKAELGDAPYRGAGFYKGVSDIRLVDPSTAPGCQFTVVADAPFLASPDGVPMAPRKSSPVALQLDRPWGNPHLAADAVGQVFLLYTDEGDVRLWRRAGLEDDWSGGELITDDGISDYPWAGKDGRGTMAVARLRGQSTTTVELSRDDGRSMEA